MSADSQRHTLNILQDWDQVCVTDIVDRNIRMRALWRHTGGQSRQVLGRGSSIPEVKSLLDESDFVNIVKVKVSKNEFFS